jgi:hypothetical protein
MSMSSIRNFVSVTVYLISVIVTLELFQSFVSEASYFIN